MREVARRRALVRVRRVFVLPLLHHVARLGKCRDDIALGIASGVSTGVIKVQMRIDHERDVRRLIAKLPQSVLQLRGVALAAILHAIDIVEFLVLLVPRAGIDEHQPALVLDEQAAHAELNPVALVRRNATLPKRFGHDAEHRATIQLLTPRLDRVHLPSPDLAALNQWSADRRCHATASSRTGCGRYDRIGGGFGVLSKVSSCSHVSTSWRRASANRCWRIRAVARASPPAR